MNEVSPNKRTVRAMVRRWRKDEARLEELFGAGSDEFSDVTEMLRNIGTAIAYAQGYVNAHDANGEFETSKEAKP